MGLLLTFLMTLLSASFPKTAHIVSGLPFRCHIYSDILFVHWVSSCFESFRLYCTGKRWPLTSEFPCPFSLLMLPPHLRTLTLSVRFKGLQKDPKLAVPTAKSAKEDQACPRIKFALCSQCRYYWSHLIPAVTSTQEVLPQCGVTVFI